MAQKPKSHKSQTRGRTPNRRTYPRLPAPNAGHTTANISALWLDDLSTFDDLDEYLPEMFLQECDLQQEREGEIS